MGWESGMLMGVAVKENDVLVSGYRCVADFGLTKASWWRKILDRYKFNDQIIQHAASVEFPNR